VVESITQNMKTVRTRIAPSPTGFPHIGTVYQVLIDFAYARKYNGKFILRLEDTDRARLVDGAEEVIYETLAWFDLMPDEYPAKGGPYAPYRQSERLDIYKKYIQELIDKKHAYYCFCTRERLEQMRRDQEASKQAPMYDKTCLKLSDEEVVKRLNEGITHVVRMNVPANEKIVVHDLLSSGIEFDSNVIDHQVIMKSDGFPTYHLGVVVDDHLMEITHVFRGKEWVPSTPKHVLLYQFFGWEMPVHAHLPLILNEDGKGKLSKRHGHASVDYYRKRGYLPQAVLNYLSNIVWNHPEGKEIYSLSEFIQLFDITQITSQAPRFDLKKLDWVNSQYIRATTDADLLKLLTAFDPKVAELDEKQALSIIPLVKERMRVLSEFWSLAGFFFGKPESFEHPLKKELVDICKAALGFCEWNHDAMEQAIRDASDKANLKARDVFMELRVAVTGKSVGPPLLESLELLGREETLSRLSFPA
jgi:glutamyl-tRNA synthetase